jgi:methylenetetrahydrofolate dehydrogenase (NADP+)/methenyltetrahydrofolate cyclohydrolase
VLLDGARLARERAAALAVRAELVRVRRGSPPRLALIAFADEDGAAPYAARKIRAASALGIEVRSLVLPAGVGTRGAERAFAALLETERCDGVFVEFPFPAGVEEEALTALIPEAADLDIMTPARIRRYLADPDSLPPLTVAAGIELLDAYGVETAGLRGLVVAEPSPFAHCFRAALARRGALLGDVVPPEAPDLEARARGAELIVAAAARPGLLRSETFLPGCVVIDAGYFNPGGRGDIDITGGIDHLAALATVPGGIGPLTIAVLCERLINFAEQGGDGSP